MRDFSSVSPQFWIGATGKSLRGDPNTQLLAMYLMTCPHANMIGVFHCPLMYISHETGLSMPVVEASLERLESADFCVYDHEDESVFVINMAAFQVGESLKEDDNKVKGVRKHVDKIASESLKAAFIDRYRSSFHISDEAPSKPLRRVKKPLGKQLTRIEQEQEQEQEQENNCAASQRVPAKSRFDEFYAAYPKKRNRGDAEKAWKRLKPDGEMADRIVAALKRAVSCPDWLKDGGQYIPYPASWLNAKGWEDELDVEFRHEGRKKDYRMHHLGFVEEHTEYGGIRGWSPTQFRSLDEYEAANGISP